MEASIKHLADSDLRHERVSAFSPQAAVGLRAVNASCWPNFARGRAVQGDPLRSVGFAASGHSL